MYSALSKGLRIKTGEDCYTLPTGSGAVSPSSGTAANSYGSWVEARSATGNALFILGYVVSPLATWAWSKIKIATGGAGSETTVFEGPAATASSSTSGAPVVVLPYPIPVAASTRIAVATADDEVLANASNVILLVVDQADLEPIP